MPDITRDRLKPFLDDLALVSAKHGLELHAELGKRVDIVVAEIDGYPGWQGYYACDTGLDAEWWLIGPEDNQAKTSGRIADLFSLDVSTATAHQRIALTRSLADTRRLVEER